MTPMKPSALAVTAQRFDNHLAGLREELVQMDDAAIGWLVEDLLSRTEHGSAAGRTRARLGLIGLLAGILAVDELRRHNEETP